MIKRVLIFGIGVSLIQVVGFYLFIFIFHLLSAAITYPRNNGFDYVTLFSAISFAVIILIQNVIAAIVNNKMVTYVLIGIAVAAYTFALIDLGSSLPFSTTLCMLFGIVVLVTKTKIDETLFK